MVNFSGDGTATLPIQTSVPVACSVVYGPTMEFGSLSLDLDMQGGTHSDHSPLLSDLEPETEYFFRVQGVDDNGVVCLSEVMTFTTPAFEAVSTENLASPQMGATVVGFSSATTLSFTVTADGGENYEPFELPDSSERYIFDVVFEAETLRFNLIETTGGNTGAVDIAVYGQLLDG